MKSYLYSLLFCICLVSFIASPSTNANQQSNIPGKTKDNCRVSIIKDSVPIAIPANSRNEYHVTSLYKNRYLYGVNLFDPYKIDVIDLTDAIVKKQIIIDKNLFNTYQVSNLFVKSADSIIFLSDKTPTIFLTNGEGKLIKKWTRTDVDIPASLDKKLSSIGFGFATSSFLENPYIDPASGYLYVKINAIGYHDDFGDIDVKRHGVYDLKNKKWISLFGSYEGVLKEKKDGRYFYDMHEPYQIKVEDKIYISYPIDNNVYCYDIKNYNLVQTIDCSFEGVEEFPKPLYGKKISDNALQKMRSNTPFYGPLNYHTAVGIFSRFYLHKGEEGKRSLIIYDKDFKVLFVCKYDISWFYKVIPTDTGFIVLPNDEATKMDPDHLNIKILKIKLN
ncbi:MAG TPA: DUF4221 family protein [Bacteroidales bacterium]|nr:DUF4221 family protein [Bacteroidales bacterium]